jgi:hypothetical protein
MSPVPFTVSYLGLGIPAVAAAVNLIRLASHNNSLTSTTTDPHQKEFSR